MLKKRIVKKKMKQLLVYLDELWDYDFNKEFMVTIDPLYSIYKPSEVYTVYHKHWLVHLQNQLDKIVENIRQDLFSMIKDYEE